MFTDTMESGLGLKRMANLLSGYPEHNLFGYPTDAIEALYFYP